MIQDNILYQDLIDDIQDRLQHLVGKAITEEDRQMLLAPERLARAATEALLRFTSIADASVIPNLVLEQTLVAIRTFRNVSSYKFPENTFAEREDGGRLSLIISGEELAWQENSSMESVLFRANNSIYGECEPCFNYDDLKKRIYTPCEVSVALVYVAMPHNIHSSDKDAGVGALIVIDGAPGAAGTMDISDGTNSVAVTFDGTETLLEFSEAIKVAVNAATTFYFNAYTPGTDRVQFNISPKAPLNGNVALSYSGLGGAQDPTVTLTKTGTYILPVGVSYHDQITELFVRQLLSLDIGGMNKVPSEEKVENKTPEKQ